MNPDDIHVYATKWAEGNRERMTYRAKVLGKTVYLGSVSMEDARKRLAAYVKTLPIAKRGHIGHGCCEPFAGEVVLPGYICCQCKHFNAWAFEACWKCSHIYLSRPEPPKSGLADPKDAMRRQLHHQLFSK